tara:strand:- start:2085 stop:2348 length:264 start_codon:yes stop_codon:yes gene_type:complete
MKQINFNNYKDKMTEKDKEEIFEIVSSRCRQKTKELLALRLEKHLDLIPEYGILNRLIKEEHGWFYCAGQSYPDEIRTVRKIILELK